MPTSLCNNGNVRGEAIQCPVFATFVGLKSGAGHMLLNSYSLLLVLTIATIV